MARKSKENEETHKEEKSPNPLAYKLGTVPHISPLLRKLAKHGLKTPDQMAATAVARGCRHYANMPAWKNVEPVLAPGITNEELAVGLLSICHPYEPLFIRVASQLLSAPGSNPKTLSRLAAMERCIPILKHIATCGKTTEPENPFWTTILEDFPKTEHRLPEFPATAVHISRFRTETGFTNPFDRYQPKIVWLRPVINS